VADQQQRDPQPTDAERHDAEDVEDLRESAKAIGVEDADQKSPEEVVDAVRHEQADSETSPSRWKADREDGAERA
jgi:hypothetical protein